MGEIPHMPKAEGERASLDAGGAGNKLAAHQPQASQAQISVQAHSRISKNGIVDGAHRYAELVGEVTAVDRVRDICREKLPDVLKNLQLTSRVR